jgi:hypothetical protein
MANSNSGFSASSSNFDVDALVSAVHTSFRSPYRERISREEVVKVVTSLDLSNQGALNRVPRLRIHRLRFTGEKHLRDGTTALIDYDQPFEAGVNVVLIPDNDVGKSSIMKTIKFALTGDNSDYDVDVRKWITAVWLVFALDQRVYTMLLAMIDDEIQAVLVPGEETHSLAYVVERSSFVFRAIGSEQVQSSIQSFFFDNLLMKPLSWNQKEPSGEFAERSTTWLTYFQALVIADGGDRYLICDTQHATGNQDGLIISTFLNLSLTEPLNKLGVEFNRAKRSVQQERFVSEEEQRVANQKIAQLEAEIETARKAIVAVDQAQQMRRASFNESDPVRLFTQAQEALTTKSAERLKLEQEREAITGQIKRVRSAARRYREQAALALHFTGLTVSLCPSCDTPVSTEAVLREQSTHECRLCGTPANAASADEIATLEAEAERADQEVAYLERGRIAMTARVAELRSEIEGIEVQLPALKLAIDNGIGTAFPTEEENIERERQLLTIGRCQGEITVLRASLAGRQPEITAIDNRVRILEKVRDAIKEEAARRDANRMERLSALTLELAHQIGAESISDLTCSALGKIQMRKHGQPVFFTNIHNEGERLRLKLAFFTAMMRMGREPGSGRHPGFLLIDQPGSSEMVPDDFQALADIFRHINQHYAEDMQVICFTARPEFAAATEPTKVYGAKAPPYAF